MVLAAHVFSWRGSIDLGLPEVVDATLSAGKRACPGGSFTILAHRGRGTWSERDCRGAGAYHWRAAMTIRQRPYALLSSLTIFRITLLGRSSLGVRSRAGC